MSPILRIPYGPDPQQFGDLQLPDREPPHPVTIVVHGGFWRTRYNLDHIGPACSALTRSGTATWSLEYRRLGNPGGGWPGTLEDVVAGAAHLTKLSAAYHLDLDRVVALGHSAGGHLTLLLGAEQPLPLRGVISLAGVSDLVRAWELQLGNGVVAELLGGTPAGAPGRYRQASPIERLPLRVPQHLLHGTRDRSVPFEMSRQYAQTAREHGDEVELILLEGSRHFELIDPKTSEFARVRESVFVLLAHRPPGA